jgi:hypothetical protein
LSSDSPKKRATEVMSERAMTGLFSRAFSQPLKLLGQSEASLSSYAVFWCVSYPCWVRPHRVAAGSNRNLTRPIAAYAACTSAAKATKYTEECWQTWKPSATTCLPARPAPRVSILESTPCPVRNQSISWTLAKRPPGNAVGGQGHLPCSDHRHLHHHAWFFRPTTSLEAHGPVSSWP